MRRQKANKKEKNIHAHTHTGLAFVAFFYIPLPHKDANQDAMETHASTLRSVRDPSCRSLATIHTHIHSALPHALRIFPEGESLAKPKRLKSLLVKTKVSTPGKPIYIQGSTYKKISRPVVLSLKDAQCDEK